MRLTKESLAPLYTNKHVSLASIARTFGMSEVAICTQARIWGLSRPTYKDDEDESPTIDEIKERAAEIRRGWTPEQRASRYVGVRRQRYQIPCYETAELTGAADLPCYARL